MVGFRRLFMNIVRFRLTNISAAERVALMNGSSNRRLILLAAGCGVAAWSMYRVRGLQSHEAVAAPPKVLTIEGIDRLSNREQRFVAFASLEYNGQVYMSPQDFLESVVESQPRPHIRRRYLSKADLQQIQKKTPPVGKGSSKLFRSLREDGVISYTEYLFLLSILTKPISGFRIAFNMFDMDGNQKVDKQEFMVLVTLLFRYFWGQNGISEPYLDASPETLEKIFAVTRKAKEKSRHEKNMEVDPDDAKMLMGKQSVDDEYQVKHTDTTLLIHFFGLKGNGQLKYEDFHTFMENLQTEVLEVEFNEFSKGGETINEMDFARILLRYTHLKPEDYNMYLTRLDERLSYRKGITFRKFKAFFQFLNSLDDFAISMKMYMYADMPISQDEFHRAVKICMGHGLSRHVVHTVFQIFDQDGDGQLSYKEFIAVMKGRLARGITAQTTRKEGWEGFRSCLKEELRSVV